MYQVCLSNKYIPNKGISTFFVLLHRFVLSSLGTKYSRTPHGLKVQVQYNAAIQRPMSGLLQDNGMCCSICAVLLTSLFTFQPKHWFHTHIHTSTSTLLSPSALPQTVKRCQHTTIQTHTHIHTWRTYTHAIRLSTGNIFCRTGSATL